MNREPTTIVGVMPDGFGFPVRQHLWSALRFEGRDWSESGVFMIGRLPSEGSLRSRIEAARAELRAQVLNLEEVLPRADGGTEPPREANVEQYTRASFPPSTIRALKVMIGASLAVYLLACINVGQLRAADLALRESAIGIQRALGASFARVVRELIAESVLIGLAAAIVGVSGAWVVTTLVGEHALRGSDFQNYFWADLRLDLASVAVAVCLALAALLAGGVVPAVIAWHRARHPELGREPRASMLTAASRVTNVGAHTFVAVQIALTLTLLAGCGVVFQATRSLLGLESGFASANLTAAIVSPYAANFRDQSEARAFGDRFLSELSAHPDITAAAFGAAPWYMDSRQPLSVLADEPVRLEELPLVRTVRVGPNYFETLELPLLRGRLPSHEEIAIAQGKEAKVAFEGKAAPRVAVLSRSLASFLGTRGSLGSEIQLHGHQKVSTFTVIGIVADLGLDHPGLYEFAEHAVYVGEGSMFQGGTLLVRSRSPGVGVPAIVDRVLERVNRRVGVHRYRSFSETEAEQTWLHRRLTQLLVVLSLGALLLSMTNLYAVIAVVVRRRFKEFGLRAALGALPRQLRSLVLGEASKGIVVGCTAGVVLSMIVFRFLGPVALGYQNEAWPMIAGTSALLVIACIVSILTPIREAARADPSQCLRSD